MVGRKAAQRIRSLHRYLGVFLGIQFLMWTLSGLYFSWTNIDEIHGDHFKREVIPVQFKDLKLGVIPKEKEITSLQLRELANEPYYWINNKELIHAETGVVKNSITEEEALVIASKYIKQELKVTGIVKIESVGKHHEYRGRPLPAFVINYDHPDRLKAYISIKDGVFQRVRHKSWRWFDFLWMTHTMDYQGRDDFNTLTLRVFSLLGLITVLSGFVLWIISSPSIRKLKKNAVKLYKK